MEKSTSVFVYHDFSEIVSRKMIFPVRDIISSRTGILFPKLSKVECPFQSDFSGKSTPHFLFELSDCDILQILVLAFSPQNLERWFRLFSAEEMDKLEVSICVQPDLLLMLPLAPHPEVSKNAFSSQTYQKLDCVCPY